MPRECPPSQRLTGKIEEGDQRRAGNEYQDRRADLLGEKDSRRDRSVVSVPGKRECVQLVQTQQQRRDAAPDEWLPP